MSPLAEGRGLKLLDSYIDLRCARVAPRGGAWIETIWKIMVKQAGVMSPLAEGRGLKPTSSFSGTRRMRSPLAEGRGLKQPKIL